MNEEDWEDDARWEAEQEERFENQAREWLRDNAAELAREFFEDNYEEAVKVFRSERLQSYYVEHPDLAVPALEALNYARTLMPTHPRAALVFGTTSTELVIKNVQRKKYFGLARSEWRRRPPWASSGVHVPPQPNPSLVVRVFKVCFNRPVQKSLARHKAAFFTLGYQSHTTNTFFDLLSENDVNILIDIRQNPVSRKRGFSKRFLEKTSARMGIEYLHFPCLGTPPRIRRLYLRTGDVKQALKQYEQHLRSRRPCLESLLRTVASRHFCLLCLESDYTSCHRSVVAQHLTEMMGCPPIHLK